MSVRRGVWVVALVLVGCSAPEPPEAPEEPAAPDTVAAPEPQAPAEADAPKAAPESAAAPALPRTAAPEGARAFIVEPQDGATVSSPFKVVFGAENIEIMKAGEVAEGAGHHHLLVNAPLPDLNAPIPNSDQYRHFGGAQTQVDLELDAGTYTLQLLFGDHYHIPHEPPVYSEVITVTVE